MKDISQFLNVSSGSNQYKLKTVVALRYRGNQNPSPLTIPVGNDEFACVSFQDIRSGTGTYQISFAGGNTFNCNSSNEESRRAGLITSFIGGPGEDVVLSKSGGSGGNSTYISVTVFQKVQ